MAKVNFYSIIENKTNKETDLKYNLLRLFDDFLQKANIKDIDTKRKIASIRAKIEIEL